MPCLGGHRLHLVLILTKLLLTNSSFFWKCEYHLTLTILLPHLTSELQHFDFSWWCSYTSVNWLQSICIGMESCLPLHMQNGLPDRTNKGASFGFEPLSIAGVCCTQQLWGIRLTCPDDRTNGHYLSIVRSLLYGSVSIGGILVIYVSPGMLDFSNYVIPQHHSLLWLSLQERGV